MGGFLCYLITADEGGMEQTMSFSSDLRSEISVTAEIPYRKAYVRQCFIEGGTVSNPIKSYHMAFTLPDKKAQKLIKYLQYYGLNPKILEKNTHAIVYLKDAEEIADAMKVMEAHKSVLAFEEMRLEKNLRNTINRKVNFETANLNKTVTAAQRQIDAIQFIDDVVGLEFLPQQLQDVAKERQADDMASLAEIGARLTPIVGKSGVNHRLRKILEIAEDIDKIILRK